MRNPMFLISKRLLEVLSSVAFLKLSHFNNLVLPLQVLPGPLVEI